VEPLEFVKEYGIRSLVCCFSGGKDSLVATHLVLDCLRDVDVEKWVVFVDTGVMVPIVFDYVRRVSDLFGWNLSVLRANPDFWSLAKRWGSPTMRRRWCCYHLKIKPIFDFVKGLRPQRGMVTGLRRQESRRRQKRLRRQIIFWRRPYAWGYAPIIDWSDRMVWGYIREKGLPIPPHYREGLKETCMCGAFSNRKEIMVLRAKYPRLFQKFIELEGYLRRGVCFYFNNRPVSVKEFLAQRTLDEMS